MIARLWPLCPLIFLYTVRLAALGRAYVKQLGLSQHTHLQADLYMQMLQILSAVVMSPSLVHPGYTWLEAVQLQGIELQQPESQLSAHA